MNYLQAVFWDYPEFIEPDTIRHYAHGSGNAGMRRWLLQRFLEHGRVVDTLSFFRWTILQRNPPMYPYSRTPEKNGGGRHADDFQLLVRLRRSSM